MIFLLLVVYQIKHFIADYPLQGKFMLGKFKKSPDFILPLLAHGLVHGSITFAIATFFKTPMVALYFGLGDMLVHCFIDRVKASPDLGGRFKAITKADFEAHVKEIHRLERLVSDSDTVGEKDALERHIGYLNNKWAETMKSNTYFWWALGADQFAHHITHYVIIWALLL